MTDWSKEQIDALAGEKIAGKSYSEIREVLKDEGHTEEEIRLLIRQVDARVLEHETLGSVASTSRQLYIGGLVLAVAGLALTIAQGKGLVLAGVSSLVAYAPFILGIILMLYGKRYGGRKQGKSQSGTGAIRRQRPFK